jgi:hypothetical protein
VAAVGVEGTVNPDIVVETEVIPLLRDMAPSWMMTREVELLVLSPYTTTRLAPWPSIPDPETSEIV